MRQCRVHCPAPVRHRHVDALAVLLPGPRRRTCSLRPRLRLARAKPLGVARRRRGDAHRSHVRPLPASPPRRIRACGVCLHRSSHGILRPPPSLGRVSTRWGWGKGWSFMRTSIRTMLAAGMSLSAATICLAPRLHAQPAKEIAVEVTNASEPVLCAEKDNVTLNLASADVRRFSIEAAHPAYIGTLQRDSFEADWTDCTGPGDPTPGPPQPPKRKTLYEQIDFWVVGLTFPTFWRPSTANVRIGDRIEKNIHLLQVWMIRPMGGEEVLVLYPQDGYWRLRPLAPAGLASTAFGSSFLVGPGEVEGRPIVKLREVAFDPKSRTFTIAFERGGAASVRMAKTDRDRNTLEVEFDKGIEGRPFAALRSMYVTDFNNDVARIAVREKGAKGWREDAIMAFARATATDVWTGRTAPSRHNTSSPDMVLNGFSDGKEPTLP